MGVHVGVPAARRNSTVVPWPVPELYDAGLRLDVLDALCAGYAALPRVMEDSALHVWVTRAGDPQPYDQDMQWWGSARQAVESRGAVMEGFYVVTRYGWLHPGSGASRSWKRLRL